MLRKEESFSVEKCGGKRWGVCVPVSRGEGSRGTLRPNGGALTTRKGRGVIIYYYLTIFFSKWRRVNLPYGLGLGPGGELVY